MHDLFYFILALNFFSYCCCPNVRAKDVELFSFIAFELKFSV